MLFLFQQHPNATNSSEASVGGVSGACGSSGIPAAAEAGYSSGVGAGTSRGGSNSSHGCDQSGNNSGSTHSHAKFRHGLLQLMIHTIDPLHDGQSRAGISSTLYHSFACLHYYRLCLLTAQHAQTPYFLLPDKPSLLSFSKALKIARAYTQCENNLRLLGWDRKFYKEIGAVCLDFKIV